MRVLVTGGLGYLGGRIAAYLSTQPNYQVILATTQPVKTPNWLPQGQVRRVTWGSLNSLQEACEGVDAVVHAAGINAQESSINPSLAFEFNAVSTGRLVQGAIHAKVKRFIYISTAHVYRDPLIGSLSEDTCATNLHPYASSHRAGEDIVRYAAQRNGIEGVVIRLSNAYGAPVHKDANCWMLLINDLCRQAVTTKQIILNTAGLQKRNFVGISDVTRAIDYLLGFKAESLGESLFNLGGDWTSTILEVAATIQVCGENILGFRPEIVINAPHKGEITHDLDYRFDRLKDLGFQLKGNKIDEIDELLKYCLKEF